MRMMRRIRNLAFLGLVITLAWAGQVKLSADSGGYYCGYGDCVFTWDDGDDCDGTWEYTSYPDLGPGWYPGDCVIILHDNTSCDADFSVSGGLYTWGGSPENIGGDRYWACYQIRPPGRE